MAIRRWASRSLGNVLTLARCCTMLHWAVQYSATLVARCCITLPIFYSLWQFRLRHLSACSITSCQTMMAWYILLLYVNTVQYYAILYYVELHYNTWPWLSMLCVEYGEEYVDIVLCTYCDGCYVLFCCILYVVVVVYGYYATLQSTVQWLELVCLGLFTIETAAPCTTIIVAVPLTISAVEAGRFKAEDMFILPSFRPSFALLILLISFWTRTSILFRSW